MKILNFSKDGMEQHPGAFEFVRPFFDVSQPVEAYGVLLYPTGTPYSYLCKRHFPDATYSPNSEWLHRMVYEKSMRLEKLDDRMDFMIDTDGGYIDLNPSQMQLDVHHFRWVDNDFVHGTETNAESAGFVLDRIDRL